MYVIGQSLVISLPKWVLLCALTPAWDLGPSRGSYQLVSKGGCLLDVYVFRGCRLQYDRLCFACTIVSNSSPTFNL